MFGSPSPFGRAAARSTRISPRLAAKVFRGPPATMPRSPLSSSRTGEARETCPTASSRGAPLLWKLRYGENPSQRGAFYGPPRGFPGGLTKLQGKEISFNNLQDLEAAVDLVRALGP